MFEYKQKVEKLHYSTWLQMVSRFFPNFYKEIYTPGFIFILDQIRDTGIIAIPTPSRGDPTGTLVFRRLISKKFFVLRQYSSLAGFAHPPVLFSNPIKIIVFFSF